MNLDILKEKTRNEFKKWLTDNFLVEDIINTEPDDWMESIDDFANKNAGLADPNIILQNEKINQIDLGDGYPENTLITGLIFDRTQQFLDGYLYDEFDYIVSEISDLDFYNKF